MPKDRVGKPGSIAPIPLSNIHVDVTTRMGSPTLATATGFPSLDRALGGGLRPGVLMTLVAEPGAGRTSFALFVAYMAARAKAATVFTSVGLDETEIMARLAARAWHREHPETALGYASIWSGQGLAEPASRAPLFAAIDTVVKKVGAQLHLRRAASLEPTSVVADVVAKLWPRNERVVLVVDDIEGFFASADGNASKQAAANATLPSRVAQIAFDLKALADQGCAVLATSLACHAEAVASASTLVARLEPKSEPSARPREVELSLIKNRLGPTHCVPLSMFPEIGRIEEVGRI